MDVSENSGTPKSYILIGFSIINQSFWGTPIFGNTHMFLSFSSYQVIAQSRRLGFHAQLEAFGAQLVSDTCWCMLGEVWGVSYYNRNIVDIVDTFLIHWIFF